MSLETVTYINDLNPANPTSSDKKSEGDDHLRNIKTALIDSFPGFTGAVAVTGVDGGAANAYTLTPVNPLLAYPSRLLTLFSPIAGNTGACTLNISGLGIKPLRASDGSELVAGDILTGIVYPVCYNGTEFRLSAPTKKYVDLVRDYATNLAFNSSLPSQTGNAGRTITTDGMTASWTNVSVKLLANITPATAATVDFLSLFSSGYDSYLVEFESLAPVVYTGAPFLTLRAANAGAADSGLNYIDTFTGSNSGTTAASWQAAPAMNSGKATGSIVVRNVNDAVNFKMVSSQAAADVNPGAYIANQRYLSYIGGSVSGLRLYWSNGSNFAVQGSIRVYGYSNS